MNESSLNYYDPEDDDFVFVNTSTGKEESYRNRHIKADEQSR